MMSLHAFLLCPIVALLTHALKYNAFQEFLDSFYLYEQVLLAVITCVERISFQFHFIPILLCIAILFIISLHN